jgi:hypothetical protein
VTYLTVRPQLAAVNFPVNVGSGREILLETIEIANHSKKLNFIVSGKLGAMTVCEIRYQNI